MGAGMGLWAPVGMLVAVGLWGLLIWGGVTIARRTGAFGMGGRTPEQTLADRYAAGEIDDDEYRKRLTTLGSRDR